MKMDDKEIRTMQFEKIEELQAENKRLCGKIIEARDCLIKKDIDAAYHALYEAANPKFDSFTPWAELEALKESQNKGG